MNTLIVVDLQKDFLPGGKLGVNKGDEIIPIVNKLLEKFNLIIFTQDWHPADHKSFASQWKDKKEFDIINLNGLEQVLWPDHCIQWTEGAFLSEDISFKSIKGDIYFFKKGLDFEVDSYSGFYDNGGKNSTGLSEFLKQRKIKKVFIGGLALDFCVKYTALDSVKEGFETYVVVDACKSISPSVKDIINDLKKENINVINSNEINKFL